MLDQLNLLLPPAWRPFAKAIMPALAGVLAAIVTALSGGGTAALNVALTAAAASALAYFVANGPVGRQRYAKAVAPAVMTVVAVLLSGLLSGGFNGTDLATVITGFGAATITFLVPNAGALAAGKGSLVADGHAPPVEQSEALVEDELSGVDEGAAFAPSGRTTSEGTPDRAHVVPADPNVKPLDDDPVNVAMKRKLAANDELLDAQLALQSAEAAVRVADRELRKAGVPVTSTEEWNASVKPDPKTVTIGPIHVSVKAAPAEVDAQVKREVDAAMRDLAKHIDEQDPPAEASS